MTWTADQERAHRAAQQAQQAAVSAVCRGLAEHASVNLTWQQAADIILHADALIALLQPFASAPEPEQITDSVECPCGILRTKNAAGRRQTKVAPDISALEEALAGFAGADAEWWMENTGFCPVSYDVVIDVQLRNGNVREYWLAGEQRWTLPGEEHDIMRWRLHKPQENK